MFNRGLDKRNVFVNKKEFGRAKDLIKFYRHKETPQRFSKVSLQPTNIREKILANLYQTERIVDILAYCLMPNHFHFLLQQNSPKGISNFIANFTNAYTRYSNTKHTRIGPLFEGVFKAVYIESEEQLLHLSRYIHINPVVSSLVKDNQIQNYPWSSYREYLSLAKDGIAEKDLVLSMFKSVGNYQEFVSDQINYAKKLETIKHLTLE